MCSIVLVAFDADTAGDEASAWWRNTLGPRAKRWRPYWGDANAMLQAVVDLRTWVREGLGNNLAERAAIMEMDGGLVRDEAERQAFALLAERTG